MERKRAGGAKVLPKEPALSRKPRRKASVVVGGVEGRVGASDWLGAFVREAL